MRLFQGEISVLQSVGKIMIFKCLPVLLLVLAAGLSGVYMVCPVDQGSLTVLRTKKTSCPFFHSSLALGKETCLLMDKFLVIIITHTKCIFYISCCLSPTALVAQICQLFLVCFPVQISILRCKAIFICIMIKRINILLQEWK